MLLLLLLMQAVCCGVPGSELLTECYKTQVVGVSKGTEAPSLKQTTPTVFFLSEQINPNKTPFLIHNSQDPFGSSPKFKVMTCVTHRLSKGTMTAHINILVLLFTKPLLFFVFLCALIFIPPPLSLSSLILNSLFSYERQVSWIIYALVLNESLLHSLWHVIRFVLLLSCTNADALLLGPATSP